MAKPSTNLKWTTHMSNIMLRRLAKLVKSGVRPEKGFKKVHLNTVGRQMTEQTSIKVTGTLDHPGDADFLNIPIENYDQMAAIFSVGQATERP
ncbi:hypothetical protein ABZP36_012766 [Zizania latifolia]